MDAGIADGQVTLVGSDSAPGQPGAAADGSSGDALVIGSRGKAEVDHCVTQVAGKCRGSVVPKGGTAAPVVARAGTPAVTIRDLASFRPAPGRQQMEPNGWVVPGLDANFYAIVDQQLVPGTLLGRPATVRFTPVGYHWNYGDGTAVVRGTKGGTWASLGLADFDATPTSHVYVVEGDYVIRLTIDFRAEYRFDTGGFTPVAGTINLPANDLRVTVDGAKTVLVDHDCLANPAGPGC